MSVDFYARGARSETLCDGTVVHPYLALEAELNLANTNAKAFLDLLDLDTDEDLYGSVLTGEVTLVEASRAWMKARARFDQLVVKHTRDSDQDGNFYTAGLDAAQLRSYLDKFRALIIEARDFDATHIY